MTAFQLPLIVAQAATPRPSLGAWLPAIAAGIVLVALVAATAFLLRRLFRTIGTQPPGVPWQPSFVQTTLILSAALLVCGAFGYLLGAALQAPRVVHLYVPVSAALARSLFFALLTIVLFTMFVRESQREDRPQVASHWGGLGGGLGGWTVSRSLVYLAAALLFAVLTAVTSYPPTPPAAAQTAAAQSASSPQQNAAAK